VNEKNIDCEHCFSEFKIRAKLPKILTKVILKIVTLGKFCIKNCFMKKKFASIKMFNLFNILELARIWFKYLSFFFSISEETMTVKLKSS